MTGADLKRSLYELKFTAGFNVRYHHRLEAFYGRWDKAIRIAVGVLAVPGLLLAVKDEPPFGVIVAIVAMAAAVVLNIIPVGDWEKRHGELFRLWSDLREDADLAELGCCDLGDAGQATEHAADRLAELTGKSHRLNAAEPLGCRWLLVECMEDETEALWGKGVRTPEDVAREQARRSSSPAAASAG
jgi:hypothetical protein